MSGVLFWDVDTQVDFMREDGKLYIAGAESLNENLARLTEAARRFRLPVIASADDHEPDDKEISDQPDWQSTYPPHCMRGTPGASRIPETTWPEGQQIGHEPMTTEALAKAVEQAAAPTPKALLIQKKMVDVFSNPNTEPLLEGIAPERAVVYGVALDVCNQQAIEGLLSRNVPVTLVVDATRAIQPERGEALIADWAERGVRMATTEEVVAELETAAAS